MSRIRLRLSEVRPGALPPVCMVCGKASAVHVPKTFAWRPQWMSIVARVGLCVCLPIAIVVLIVGYVQTRRVTVDGPLCARHRHYWFWRAFWVYVPLLVLLVVALTQAALIMSDTIPDTLFGPLLIATGLMLLVWGLTAWFLNQSGIKAVEITDDDISLEPVSAEFADLVRYERTTRKRDAVPVWDDYDPYPRLAPPAPGAGKK